MKQNIMAAFAAAASILMAVSCQKQEPLKVQEQEQTRTETVGDGVSFTATIEQDLTKTTITEERKVEWVSDDRISVNGAEYAAEPGVPASEAKFVHKDGDAPQAPYKAIYPATLYNASTGGYEFPSTITYKGGLDTPMYAESDTEKLSFKNICGVLHLTLYSCNEDIVKRITVEANEAICGPFNVSMNEDGTPSVHFTGGGKVVTVDCGQGVKLSIEPKDFFIPIPEGKYSPGMTITATGEEDKIIYQKKTVIPVEIYRNRIYNIEWGKIEVDYKNVYKQMALLIGSKQPGKEYNPYRVLFNMCGDDVCAADAYNNGYPFIAQLNDFTYTPDNEVIRNCYTNFYKAIDICNRFLGDYGEKTGAVGIDNKQVHVEELVAEVRTLRAWLYFTLAEGWGNIPLFEEYPAPENPKIAQQAEIYDWIEGELEKCVPSLSERMNPADQEGAVKVTKGFARALFGKVLLFDGEPAKAAALLKEVFDSNKYAIVPGERFFDLFHKEGNGCEEKIFELDMSNVADYDYAGTETKLWACNDNCFVASPWGAWQASKSAWGLGLPDYYAKGFLENDGDSYRRKAVFLTSDEVFYDSELAPYDILNWNEYTWDQKRFSDKIGIKSDGLYGQCDVMPRKLIVSHTDAPSGPNMTNFTVMRLGEVYLLYAEACIRNGNPLEAKKYINQIQERAGSKTISDQPSIDDLIREKMYELWMEGCRWADIMRWGQEKAPEAMVNLEKAGTEVCKAEDEYTTSGGTNPHKLVYSKVSVKDNGSFNLGTHRFFPKPAVQ